MENQIDTQGPLWEVFTQAQPGAAYKHAGSVHGADKTLAMQNARDAYYRRQEGCSIWIVPSNCIVASSPEDSEMFFDPANDKAYRHPTFYTMPEGALHI